MNTDAIIIGAGLMGSSIALQLARRGMKCLVLDRENPGRHASGVNAGGLRRLNRHPAEIPLSVAAARIWLNIRELVDDDCGTHFPGQIRIAENDSDLEKLKQRAEQVRALGYDHEELIDRNELYQLVPELASHCIGGLICRDDGYGQPFHALTAFRHKAVGLGVDFRIGARVDKIDKAGMNWKVSTATGDFMAPLLINSAGAWSHQICEILGEPVPLNPASPMIMVTERLPHFLDPVLGAASRKLSFKQMPNGTLLIGGAHLARLDFSHERTQIEWSKMAVSARSVLALFPQLKDVRIVRSWAGVEAFMPDHLPVIGAGREQGTFHAFGFSAHGFQLSPIVGLIIAQLILDGKSEFPIEAFSINRFK
jgi:sarcosine oxidase subunit beta